MFQCFTQFGLPQSMKMKMSEDPGTLTGRSSFPLQLLHQKFTIELAQSDSPELELSVSAEQSKIIQN